MVPSKSNVNIRARFRLDTMLSILPSIRSVRASSWLTLCRIVSFVCEALCRSTKHSAHMNGSLSPLVDFFDACPYGWHVADSAVPVFQIHCCKVFEGSHEDILRKYSYWRQRGFAALRQRLRAKYVIDDPCNPL
jgi:hypothetical protein